MESVANVTMTMAHKEAGLGAPGTGADQQTGSTLAASRTGTDRLTASRTMRSTIRFASCVAALPRPPALRAA